jgi:hypothetical protein
MKSKIYRSIKITWNKQELVKMNAQNTMHCSGNECNNMIHNRLQHIRIAQTEDLIKKSTTQFLDHQQTEERNVKRCITKGVYWGGEKFWGICEFNT